MRLRVLNLDDALTAQAQLVRKFAPEVVDLTEWGLSLRMSCRFGTYRRFEAHLERVLAEDNQPALTFLGSGDFHHVTLALLRRLQSPFNLLVIDKHPDWMRGIPVMHCGTWLHHALRLPNLQCVFHVGGDLDFDNLYRWLAPWDELRSGRVTVIPAWRRYCKGSWSNVSHRPLLERPLEPSDVLERALGPLLAQLADYPLYISFDKDALNAAEAVVNWDSGVLGFEDARDVITWFREASGGNLIGMDVVGDWSPVRMRWGLRKLCHWMEHPHLHINPKIATRINEGLNAAINEHMQRESPRPIRKPRDLVAAR
jgi:arginase family enzyme